MSGEKISFKKLDYVDLDLMSEWLSSPEVKKWYPVSDTSRAGVKKKYTPQIEGNERIQGFIILVNQEKIGYIQSYWCKDFPNPALPVKSPDLSSGLDIFIGDELWRGKGLGPQILRLFLSEIVFGSMGANHCIVDPLSTNSRAIRAYQSVGFSDFVVSSAPGESYKFLIAHSNR